MLQADRLMVGLQHGYIIRYRSQNICISRLLMNPEQREALYGNTARAMGDAPDFIKQRHIDHCMQCDPEYGEGVAKALGMFKG